MPHVAEPPSEPAEAFGQIQDPLLAELASAALEAAEAAALLLASAMGGERREVSTKSSSTDMVSEVDHEAERVIAAVLARRRPEDAVVGEEGTARPGKSGVRWVVDPLDGTTNFLFGVPAFSVSVAAELRGGPVVAVVCDPSRRETWTAASGQGARLNGVPCSVAAGRSTLATALVATGFAYSRDRRAWQAEVLGRVLPAVRDIRRFGSAALDLCWVAGGRFDAFYEWGLKPWDLCAGKLICEEAGARVEVLPSRTLVAAPLSLFDSLRDLLERAGAADPWLEG